MPDNTIDGTPDAVKVACPVWSGGKSGDDFKGLPITIVRRGDFSSGWKGYNDAFDFKQCIPCKGNATVKFQTEQKSVERSVFL